MRNKIVDVNGMLVEQMQRLNNGDMDAENLQLEAKRAKAMAEVAEQFMEGARLTLSAAQLKFKMEQEGIVLNGANLPKMLTDGVDHDPNR